MALAGSLLTAPLIVFELADTRRVRLAGDGLGFVDVANANANANAAQAGAAVAIDWAKAKPLPPDLRDSIAASWRGDGVSLERLLLDLHAGRFLGGARAALMDALGVAILLLVVTGLLSVLRARRRRGGRSPIK